MWMCSCTGLAVKYLNVVVYIACSCCGAGGNDMCVLLVAGNRAAVRALLVAHRVQEVLSRATSRQTAFK